MQTLHRDQIFISVSGPVSGPVRNLQAVRSLQAGLREVCHRSVSGHRQITARSQANHNPLTGKSYTAHNQITTRSQGLQPPNLRLQNSYRLAYNSPYSIPHKNKQFKVYRVSMAVEVLTLLVTRSYLEQRASLLGAKMLLGAPGIASRSKDAISSYSCRLDRSFGQLRLRVFSNAQLP